VQTLRSKIHYPYAKPPAMQQMPVRLLGPRTQEGQVTETEQIVDRVMGDYLESLKRPNPYLAPRHPAIVTAHTLALYAIRAIFHIVAIIL